MAGQGTQSRRCGGVGMWGWTLGFERNLAKYFNIFPSLDIWGDLSRGWVPPGQSSFVIMSMVNRNHRPSDTEYSYIQSVPEKCRDVLNCHNSFKIGTRNKSRVSFEILRKSSCWWALKFFNFDFWGLSKWGLKLVTLHQKAWPNQTFSVPVFSWHKWNWNTLVFHMNISLLCSWTISMIFFCGWGIDTQV